MSINHPINPPDAHAQDPVLNRFLGAGMVLALFLSLLMLMVRVLLVYARTADLAGMEMNVIYGIQRIMSHNGLYTDPQQPPFAIVLYSPLYCYLVAGIAKLLRLQPGIDLLVIYEIGRWANILFNIASACIGYRILRDIFTVRRSAACLGAALIWLCFYNINYAVRPDSMKSFFFILGAYYFLLSGNTGKSKHVIIAAISGCCAAFAKQDGIIFCLVILVFYLWRKEYRLFIMALTAIAVTQLCFHAIMTALYGQAFFLNTVKGLDNGISIEWLKFAFKGYPQRMFFFIALGIGAGILFLWRGDSGAHRALGLLALTTFCAESALILKFGSVPAYFVDFHNLAFIVTGLILGRTIGTGEDIFYQRLFAVLVICALLIVPSYHLTDAKIFQTINDSREYDADVALAKMLVPMLGCDSSRAYITTTRPFLLNLAQPYVLDPQPDIADTCLYRRHVYRYDLFDSLVVRGKVRFMVRKSTDPPPAIKLGASLSRFRYWITVGQAGIWRYE